MRLQSSTHQLLDLALEHGVDPDDEGGGRAENLQQAGRQDGDVGVTGVRTGEDSEYTLFRTKSKVSLREYVVFPKPRESFEPFFYLSFIVVNYQIKSVLTWMLFI